MKSVAEQKKQLCERTKQKKRELSNSDVTVRNFSPNSIIVKGQMVMKNPMGGDMLSKMERARQTQEQFKRAVDKKFEVQQQKMLEAREVKSKLAESRPALRAPSIKELEKKEA